MDELRLPELGENIESADVAQVLVRVGERVRRDQPVIEVETEKATLEVPATADGVVRELLVRPGDRIRVGGVILRFEAEGAPREAAPAPIESAPSVAPPEPAVAVAAGGGVIAFPVPGRRPELGPTVAAAPSVRALARELGLDVRSVPGSGPGGRISRDDVKAHAKRLLGAVAAGAAPTAAPALPDFAQWGPIEAEPLSAVRRATARSMAVAWTQVAHVTQFDRADVTELESFRQRFNEAQRSSGRKLSLTAIVVKLVAAILERFPRFNASLDLEREVTVLKRYVHVGVAVDTERGLLVPVIRDADAKRLLDVSAELEQLASRARERKLGLEQMQGATFTVSNLGGLGTTWFSPIVPWPQAAILGVGRSEIQAVWTGAEFAPRRILPLSLSYDHRIVDGADAARFLRALAEALERPLAPLLEE